MQAPASVTRLWNLSDAGPVTQRRWGRKVTVLPIDAIVITYADKRLSTVLTIRGRILHPRTGKPGPIQTLGYADIAALDEHSIRRAPKWARKLVASMIWRDKVAA